MTFSPNIPQATDDPAISQGQILTNFSELNTLFNVDHVQYTDATVADRGKHRQVTVLNSAAAPATGATEGIFYVFNTGGARQQAYYRREGSGVQIPISTYYGAFVRVTAAGAILGDNFNIAAVAPGGAGIYNVTFTNAFTSVNYLSLVQIHNDVGQSWTENFAVGSMQVRTATTAGALVNRAFSLFVIGEIA